MTRRKYPLNVWHSDDSDCEAVCASEGHHDKALFAAEMERELDYRPRSLDAIWHVWWRHDIAHWDPEGGPCYVNEVYRPGPGAKPMTVCYDFEFVFAEEGEPCGGRG